MPSRNLLLFGCDFFPEKKTSEINFWNDMIYFFRERFQEVVVLSVNNRDLPQEKLSENVYLYNVKPHYFGNSMEWKDPEYSGRRFHRLPLSTVYKTYSLWRFLPIFAKLVREHNIGVIHYMRVFGLFNEVLMKRHPEVRFSITVPTHVDRGFPLHHLYHLVKNAALRPMDKVVATSRATHNRLLHLGFHHRKLQVIPWSTREETKDFSPEAKNRIRATFDIPIGPEIVLWSGPLQDTGPREFLYALNIAENVCERSDRYTFVFAVKTDQLRTIMKDVVIESRKIRVLETDRSGFSSLKAITRVLLSPVCNKNRTVAPPLTWIEMMHHGIPIITTPVAGTEELVAHGVTGFVLEGIRKSAEVLLNTDSAELERMGTQCKRVVAEDYSIRDIAEKYTSMWDAAVGRPRPL